MGAAEGALDVWGQVAESAGSPRAELGLTPAPGSGHVLVCSCGLVPAPPPLPW